MLTARTSENSPVLARLRFVHANRSSGRTSSWKQGFPWVHPVVLATFWTHQIAFCSRALGTFL